LLKHKDWCDNPKKRSPGWPMTAKPRNNRKTDALAKRYETALRRYLADGPAASLEPAARLGRAAVAAGLETLELALIHERALVQQALPAATVKVRNRIIKRAGKFFAEAVLPMEETHRAAREVNAHLSELTAGLSRYTGEILAANRKLTQEVARRKAAERTLRQSRKETSGLLADARRAHKHLQLLSRRILSAQEDERRRISRELHDVVAQMLNGINLRLAELNVDTVANAAGLGMKIARTQRLVVESVDSLHRFARQLRPAMLDDLGLIPALETFLKSFANDMGLRVTLTADREVEKLNGAKRTALYRLAQEALTNVARHAKADRVRIRIQCQADAVQMSIKDNGKAFNVKQVMDSGKVRHLGLLGMKERVEMLGGTFEIRSAPGKGTDVRVAVPLNHGRKGRKPQ
jgi:signal transduction histidine kinase